MNIAGLATRRLREALRQLKKISSQRHVLESHLDGFYSEVDKLAKGRAMLEVTPFILEQANEVIKDAKTIITQDVHLDRIKEFVPAGNNPVYPDVLVAMKGIQQSLRRAKGTFEESRSRINDRLIKAETIAAALQAYFNEDDPDAVPMKQDVEGRTREVEDESVVKIGKCKPSSRQRAETTACAVSRTHGTSV
jgi:hypothetical protein